MNESGITAKLRQAIKNAGGLAVKIHQGKFGGGFPDLVVFGLDKVDPVSYDVGLPVFIEVKIHPNKPTEQQKAMLRAIANQGARSEVWSWVPDMKLPGAKRSGAFRITTADTEGAPFGTAAFGFRKPGELWLSWLSTVGDIWTTPVKVTGQKRKSKS